MMYKCPKCDGKGYYWNKGETLLIGILSLGMIPFMDAISEADNRGCKKQCEVCDEKGVIHA